MANTIYAAKSDNITQRETDNAQLARSLADECMVLLKNKGALPVAKGTSIALYGNGARNTIKGGTGSGDVNSRSVTNIETGLKEAGLEITTTDWLNRNEKYRTEKKSEYLKWISEEAKRQNRPEMFIIFDHPFEEPDIVEITKEDISASQTDTAIFVIARNSGEGADRKNVAGDYQLMKQEADNLKILTENYKKVIVVLNIGGVFHMTDINEMEGVSSILLMTQLGNLGGAALGDVVTGAVSPSGHLSDTWAKDYMDYPSSAEFSFNNGDVHEDYYKDGIYVGYRYFDSFKKSVTYPFGYGLSYTDFQIDVVSVEQKNAELEIKTSVKNIGKTYSGKEVVQVYISAPKGKLDKPYQELKGFAKTSVLKPSETETLTITVPLASFASYDMEEAAWIIEKGDYTVRVGNNCQDTVPGATVTIPENVITEECENCFPLDCELEELRADYEISASDAKIKLTVDTSKIPVNKVVYQENRPEMKCSKTQQLTLDDVKAGNCTLDELIAQLTVEEMATLCVGVFGNGRENSIVGAASACVPGAAGETSGLLSVSRKIRKTINADGPAGLRLVPHFITDKDGNRIPGGDIFGDTVSPFPENIPADAVDYYQYCTAIPIGWALAQSWNCQLIKEIGHMVGTEMELFGVDFWLAPAQNIHRNPLCGRNFEYYSEDPFLTGKVSAAITNGVQSVPGRCTTIKHFAANNQEENRYFVNAHVSERTLREIYLKGFEIAVKESHPMSLMTSYNLLNGTHTPNRKDLLQSVLRDEWGFDGVVMTDWFTSQNVPGMTGKYLPVHYPISASTGCIYSGNDLQMPGCQKNIDDIVAAVSENKEIDGYKISLGDLQFCTKNLLRVILKLDGAC